MKTYRQPEKQGTKVADSNKGPDEAKIKALLERTDYTLDVTTAQRKYGGPPPECVCSGQQPFVGTEYNNHEIRSAKHIGVCISVATNRLFVGSIDKRKTKKQIVEEFNKVAGSEHIW